MEETKERKREKQVLALACRALERERISFDSVWEEGEIYFDLPCDGGGVQSKFTTHTKNQWIRLIAWLPLQAELRYREVLGMAAAQADARMKTGGFDFDRDQGKLCYRLTQCFKGSLLGEELILHMLNEAREAVEQYQESFFRVGKGMLSLDGFLEGFPKEED